MLKGTLNKDMKLSQVLSLIRSNKYSGILYIGENEENVVVVKEGRIVFASYNDFQNLDALKEIAVSNETFEFTPQQNVLFKSDFEKQSENAVEEVLKVEEDFNKVSYLLDKFVNVSEGSENVNLSSDEIKFLASLEFKPQSVKKLIQSIRKPSIDTLLFIERLIEKGVLKAYSIKNPKEYEFIVDNYPDLAPVFESVGGDVSKFESEISKNYKNIARQVISELRKIRR